MNMNSITFQPKKKKKKTLSSTLMKFQDDIAVLY